MTWVKRVERPPWAWPHRCEPPTVKVEPKWLGLTVPDAGLGALWRCDCGRLYRVGRIVAGGLLYWLPARWWQRWWYRRSR